MDDLLGLIFLVSLVINALLGSAQLADWLEKRRGGNTTAFTNADPRPQVVNIEGDVYNFSVPSRDTPVVSPVPGPAQTANDYGLTGLGGGAPLTGGICPFVAPPRPEL